MPATKGSGKQLSPSDKKEVVMYFTVYNTSGEYVTEGAYYQAEGLSVGSMFTILSGGVVQYYLVSGTDTLTVSSKSFV